MPDVVKSIGTDARDYATMVLWEAAIDDTTYPDASTHAIGECYDDSAFDLTATLTINAAPTNVTAITLTAASGQQHDGTAGTGVRIVQSTTIATQIVLATTKPTTLSWIELNCNGKGTSTYAGINRGTAAHAVHHMLVHDLKTTGGNSAGDVFGIVNGAGGSGPLHNNILYNVFCTSTGGGIGRGFGFPTGGPHQHYNNTVYNVRAVQGANSVNHQGINVSDSNTGDACRNNIVVGTATAGSGTPKDFEYNGGSSGTFTHNMSSDATADDAGSDHIISVTAADQFVSVVAGSEDLHLKTGADAIDAGTDLGTTPTGVNLDIDGRDRDAEGDTWDIGADEFVDAGSATAAVTGTATDTIDESDIVSGGETLILTLTGETWVTVGSTFNSERQNIINGINGDDDDQLRSGLDVTDVVRTSDTIVTITLSAIPGYDISSQIEYEITIPATALTGGNAIVATPTFTVDTTVQASSGVKIRRLGGVYYARSIPIGVEGVCIF